MREGLDRAGGGCRSRRDISGFAVRIARLLPSCAAAVLLGCGAVANPGDGGFLEDGNVGDVSGVTGKTRGEPNDAFEAAIIAVFNAEDEASLQGTILTSEDVDVFSLGAVSVGDRIRISATTPGSPLDVSLVLFDADGAIVFANDDISDSNLDAELDHVARHEGDPYYVMVSASTFAFADEAEGTYRVEVRVDSGEEVPAPAAQALFLDFRGGTVNSPVLGTVEVDPFDAGRISSVYEGDDEELKTLIRAEIVSNFSPFNVSVLTSDEFTPDDETRVTTLYLGGYAPDIFGEAEAIDWYNINCCDDAIIYTEAFDPDSVFLSPPTVSQLARAIGNVASHEAGHLLGLNHTNDDRDLMDDRSPSISLTRDQNFTIAPLSTQIAPIGVQDSALLLLETLGPPL